MSLHSTVGAPPQGNEKLPSTGALSSTAPVVSQLLFSFGPRPGLALAVEGRRVSDLLFRDIRVEAFKLWVVSQHVPRDCEMMDAQAQEASERHVHIEHTPTHLLNQQPLDRANLVVVPVEHSRPFDAITLDDGLE